MADGTLPTQESDWSKKIRDAIAPKADPGVGAAVSNPIAAVSAMIAQPSTTSALKRVAQGYTAPLPDKAVPNFAKPVQQFLSAPEGGVRDRAAKRIEAAPRKGEEVASLLAAPFASLIRDPVRAASEVSGFAPATRMLDAAGNVAAEKDPLKALGAGARAATEGGAAALSLLGEGLAAKEALGAAKRIAGNTRAARVSGYQPKTKQPLETMRAENDVFDNNVADDPQYSRGNTQGGSSKVRDYIIERAEGVAPRDIATLFEVDANNVKASLSQAKKIITRRIAEGTPAEKIAAEMNISPDYLEKFLTGTVKRGRPGIGPDGTSLKDAVARLMEVSKDSGGIEVDAMLQRLGAQGFRDVDAKDVTTAMSTVRKASMPEAAAPIAPKAPPPEYAPSARTFREASPSTREIEALTNPSPSTIGKMLREQRLSGQSAPLRYIIDEQGNAHVWNSTMGALHDDAARGLGVDPSKMAKGILETPDDIQEFNLAARNARRKWAADNGYSRSEFPGLGSSVQDLTRAVRDSWGADSRKLMQAGRVRVVESVDDLPRLAQGEHPRDVKALYDRNSGMTWVVADNTSLSEAKGIVLHEIGEHHGLKDMLGDRYGALTEQMKKLRAAGNKDVTAAYERATKNAARPDQIDSEAIAYLLEAKPNAPISVKFIQAIREWFNRNFGTVKNFMRGREVNLTTEDIRQLGVASLRRAAAKADEAAAGSAVDPMYAFGAMEDKAARQAWAAGKEVKKETFNSDFYDDFRKKFKPNYAYTFPVGESRMRVEFNREPISGMYDVTFYNPDRGGWIKFQPEPGILGKKPGEGFGKIAAILERFAEEHGASSLKFTGANDRLSRLYSRMLLKLTPEGWSAWDISNPRVFGHQFIIAKGKPDLKAMFGRAEPLTEPLTSEAMKAKEASVRANLGLPEMPRDFSFSRGERSAQQTPPARTTREKIADFLEGKSPPRPEPKTPQQRRARGMEKIAELVGGTAGGAAGGAVAANSMIVETREAKKREEAERIRRAADLARIDNQVKTFRFERDNPVEAIPEKTTLDEKISRIAKRQGVPNEFLSQLVQKESGGREDVGNETSSAVGATQFIEGTWKKVLAEDPESLGFKGDPNSPEALELRKDPRWAVSAAAVHAKKNAETLAKALGRDPTQGEVYVAHFLGIDGAKKALKADPSVIAAKLLPAAADANENVFYVKGDKSKPRTVRQVIELQTKGFSKEPFKVDPAETGRKVLKEPANPQAAPVS